jgi:hypothetical protein
VQAPGGYSTLLPESVYCPDKYAFSGGKVLYLSSISGGIPPPRKEDRIVASKVRKSEDSILVMFVDARTKMAYWGRASCAYVKAHSGQRVYGIGTDVTAETVRFMCLTGVLTLAEGKIMVEA